MIRKRLLINCCLALILAAVAFVSQATTVTALAESPAASPEMSATVSAEATPKARHLSLRACFDQGDAQNKEIKVATANLSIAQAQIVIAKAIPNPIFNMTYGFGPAWKFIVAGNNQQVGWSEEIQVAGRRTKKTAVAGANYFQTAFQIEAVRFSVHNRIRRAYTELATALAYAELVKGQESIARELFSISQKRFDAGKAPGSQVQQAKLAVMQFKTQLNQASGRVAQDTARLLQLLGEVPNGDDLIVVDENSLFKPSALSQSESGAPNIVPDPKLALPSLESLIPAAMRERKDLKAAIQRAYSDRKALTLAKTARIPDPILGFDYMFSTYKSLQPQYFSPDGTGLPTAANKVPFQPGYLLTLAEEVPIFYQYQGQVNQARAVWNQQLKQNELSSAQIAADTVTAYEALTLAVHNIEKFQKELLPRATTVAQLSLRGYRLGRVDLATTILAQQQFQQLRASYFDAIVAHQNAWADLEQAMGVPLKQP